MKVCMLTGGETGIYKYSKDLAKESEKIDLSNFSLSKLFDKYDIYHIQHGFFIINHIKFFLFLFLAKLLGKKVVITLHDTVFPYHLNKKGFRRDNDITVPYPIIYAVLWVFYNFIQGFSDLIITHKEPSQPQDFLEDYEVIPHFVKNRESVQSNGDKVLIFGYLSRYKGIKQVVKELDKEIYLVGGLHPRYPPEDYLDWINKVVGRSNVKWFGFQPYPKLREILKEVKVAIFNYPYDFSASGAMNTIISYEIPVLCRQDGNFDVPPILKYSDIPELKDRIKENMEEEKNVVSDIKQNRNISNIVDMHLQKYLEVLDG